MNNEPLVSIIIPTYNRGELLIETLESIIKQSYSNWECIVVDDGSKNDVIEQIEKYCQTYSKITFLKRPENLPKGANACRNYGFKKSKGQYINWFDSDDIMHRDKLKIQVGHLNQSDLPFTVCQTMVFEGETENVLGLRSKEIYSNNFFGDFITNKIKWLTQAPLIKRNFIEQNGLSFDESLAQSQERDFFIRVLDLVENYHYDDKVLVYFRKHSDSISHGIFSEEKLKSNFKVNFMALSVYGHKLKPSEKLILKKGIKQVVKKCIQNKYFRLLKEIKNKTKDSFSSIEKLKLNLAILIYRYTNKGDILFK